MSNHWIHCLTQWQGLKYQASWVLGAIYTTTGPVYRKTGALMLLSDQGHQLGLLSGGCLEADLVRQARRAVALNQSREVVYDGSDADNIAWQLGIGCGGAAHIILHPCNEKNDFLKLGEAYRLLKNHMSCRYILDLALANAQAEVREAQTDFSQRVAGKMIREGLSRKLLIHLNPTPHLMIFGSGIDIPVITRLAAVLGWQVSVVTRPRTIATSSQRKRLQKNFGPDVQFVSIDDVTPEVLKRVDAAIVASHNIEMDAEALAKLSAAKLQYIGLLGPATRREKVLSILRRNNIAFNQPLASPMGLALGGDLPESIALSVLAECHAALYGEHANSLSQYLSVCSPVVKHSSSVKTSVVKHGSVVNCVEREDRNRPLGLEQAVLNES